MDKLITKNANYEDLFDAEMWKQLDPLAMTGRVMRGEEETTEYFKIMERREKIRKEKEETTRREKMWREEMRKEKREEKDSDHLNNEINDENRDPNYVYQAPGSRIIHHVRVMPGYLFLMHYWC